MPNLSIRIHLSVILQRYLSVWLEISAFLPCLKILHQLTIAIEYQEKFRSMRQWGANELFLSKLCDFGHRCPKERISFQFKDCIPLKLLQNEQLCLSNFLVIHLKLQARLLKILEYISVLLLDIWKCPFPLVYHWYI